VKDVRRTLASFLLLIAGIVRSGTADAQVRTSEYEAEKLRLAKAASEAEMTLLEGLELAEPFGRPVSGSFRNEGGSVRLIIYVKKGESVYRVQPRHRGKKPQVAEVTDPHEYSDAYADAAAMVHATKSLRQAVQESLQGDVSLVATAVVPRSSGRHSSAEVTIFDGRVVKRVAVPL